ncbi:hypothetical protein [Streptomyces sp. NRRL B-24085]|uniref:hypothetical protein n=2 Tax=Streptomyces sp. NRRL B-24085 TaxID=1709476 RepID=UPI0006B2FB50|nr:hypothetical protein [Streptomyces sp. NRRL B-24085]
MPYMFLHLPTYAWALMAAVVTPAHIALMRWAMPTPKGKRSVSFIPLVLGAVLLMYAVANSYSASVTLYLYSSVLLMFLVVILPVRKRVASEILEQEENPDSEVKVDGLSLAWITFSLLVTMGIVIAVWLSHT